MPRVTAEEVQRILVSHIRDVMALPGAGPPRGASDWRAVRLEDDLHADSLDLVEVVERVEQELGRRGVAVSLADSELAELATVGKLADALFARIAVGGGASGRAS